MRDNVVAQADVAGHTLHAPVARQAAVRVVGIDERENVLSRLFDLGRIGTDDHLVADGRCAGQLEAAARAFDLDEASATARVRRQAVDVAEIRDVDAVFFDDLNERCAVWRLNLAAVDGKFSHALGDSP